MKAKMQELPGLAEQLDASFKELIAYTKSPDTYKGRVRTRVLQVAPVEEVKPEQVRRLRVGLKLSQEQFAFLMGVSTNLVSKWEQGSHEPTGTALRLMQIIKFDPRIMSNVGVLSDSITPSRKKPAVQKQTAVSVIKARIAPERKGIVARGAVLKAKITPERKRMVALK